MKVFPFNIPKPLNEKLIVQEDFGTELYDRYHQHQEIQISLILFGEGKLIVSGSVHAFAPGALFVIGSKVPHVFQYTKDIGPSHIISLFFTKETFGPSFFNMPDLDVLTSFFDRCKIGCRPIENNPELIERIKSMPSKPKFERFIDFLYILRSLAQLPVEELSGFIHKKKLTPNEGSRLQDTMAYVMENFQNEITLKTVAELACMTQNSFCRFFKQRTNKTFFQFVLELRVAHACQLLQVYPDRPIFEIADASGFRTLSNFNRKFKDIKGVSPTAYRSSYT
jgi:AraC-like DNA-binding protein